jgi:hypothetical protein
LLGLHVAPLVHFAPVITSNGVFVGLIVAREHG